MGAVPPKAATGYDVVVIGSGVGSYTAADRAGHLRALVEVYAGGDSMRKFVNDSVAAWTKAMNADRSMSPDYKRNFGCR
jgi:catalase (peroxidase I)